MSQPTILVTRAQGGLGDIICTTVAMRAAHDKYAPLGFRVVGSFGRTIWKELFEDQNVCDEIVGCEWCRMNPETVRQKYVHHFSLDGPERIYEQDVKWNVQRPRVETWCLSVDSVPASMCPRWKATDQELAWAMEWVESRGMKPREFMILQWRADDGMRWKDYPHRLDLARELLQFGSVCVLHKWESHYRVDPEWHELMAVPGLVVSADLSLRQLGALLSLSSIIIGPDSAFLHFAAAVQRPFLGIFGGTSGSVSCRYYPLAQWIQAPVNPTDICKNTAPCYGTSDRNFWCHGKPNLRAECMTRVSPKETCRVVEKMLAK